jgi:hypothetical protein
MPAKPFFTNFAARRIGEALHVDEVGVLLQQLREQRGGGHAEDLVGGKGELLRLRHLRRVGVDRGRLLADRELHARCGRRPCRGRRGS